MEFYVIAEGWGDVAVLKTLLKGVLGIDSSSVHAIRPSEQLDETDLHTMRPENFSNWTLVKEECSKGAKLKEALTVFEDIRYLIIHLDTDMRNERGYDVHEPQSLTSMNDHDLLVANVRCKILEWMGEDRVADENLLFAIAVQETDAWLLAHWDSRLVETGNLPNAKERLIRYLSNLQVSSKEKAKLFQSGNTRAEYLERSRGLRKKKILNEARSRNRSLDLFVTQLELLVNGGAPA